MISVQDLEITTNKFFTDLCNDAISRPIWSSKWCFKDTLPNNSSKGCYAHLIGNEVVYIGLAIGNSFEGSGIGARVSKYWRKGENYCSTNHIYSPINKDLTAIITLAFNNDNFYLAAALEVYLIQHLDPPNNRTHSKYK